VSLNIKLIQESFRAIRPHATEVIEHFYNELFESYPESKDLFNNINMKKQNKALTNRLAHIVEFINETEHLKQYLQTMGARHENYGVLPEHYSWVGEALLSTFEYYFGDNWTDELKESWTAAYSFISTEMIEGMSEKSENVVSLKNSTPELNIHEVAKKFSNELILKSLNEELAKSDWEKFIQDKIAFIIKKAIEDEVKHILNETMYNSKVA
jgi:hemoglobin-like flavoprotein